MAIDLWLLPWGDRRMRQGKCQVLLKKRDKKVAISAMNADCPGYNYEKFSANMTKHLIFQGRRTKNASSSIVIGSVMLYPAAR